MSERASKEAETERGEEGGGREREMRMEEGAGERNKDYRCTRKPGAKSLHTPAPRPLRYWARSLSLDGQQATTVFYELKKSKSLTMAV